MRRILLGKKVVVSPEDPLSIKSYMPGPTQRFNDHGVHEVLSGLRSRVTEIPSDLSEQTNSVEPTESLDRLDAVLDYVEAVLAAVDPRLVTAAMLAALEAPVQQARAGVDALIDQSDPNQAQAITNATEAVLDAVGAWPMTAPMASAEARQAASELGRASKDRLREIKRDADQMKGEVTDLRSDLDQSKTEVQENANQQFEQLGTTVEQIKADVENEKTRATQAIDGIQEQFNAEQSNRNAEFEQLKSESREKAEEIDRNLKAEAERIGNELSEKAEETSKNIEERGDKLVEALEEKREQAERLVDLVATSSTAGAFGKEADDQKEEADRWRGRTVKLGLAAAAVALFAVVYAVFGDTSVSLAIGKIAAVVLLTGLATYAANQSGHHRQREVRARRLELQMTAFGPITEPLKDDVAERDARKGFIERMFPGDISVSGESDSGLTKPESTDPPGG